MKKILIAFQFLTIIPIKRHMNITEEDIAKSSSAFSIVGLFQGILLIATDYISGLAFHPDLVIGIILLVLVLSNGGLHLDGLADTFDAITAKSEGNIELDRLKRLSIMKDGSTGPAGVSAILFVLAIKYLSLRGLSNSLSFYYYSSLLFMPVISKWTMIVSMFHGRPSMKEGLGRIFIGRIGFKEVVISSLMLYLLLIPINVFFGHYVKSSYIFYMTLLIVMYLLCLIWIKYFDKKFGGLNGDTLGAISEITEVSFLLLVIIWSRLFI